MAILDAGVQRYSTHPFHLDLSKLGLKGPQQGKNLWSGQPITLTAQMPIEMTWHDVLLVRIAPPQH